MRFVPYVGSFIAAAFPLLLAAAVAPGWTTFLLTFLLYLISETLMGQVVEPLVYGHGTGLSQSRWLPLPCSGRGYGARWAFC